MITILKHPNTTVHKGIIKDNTLKPLCEAVTNAQGKWSRLPGHMTVTCKRCLHFMKEQTK